MGCVEREAIMGNGEELIITDEERGRGGKYSTGDRGLRKDRYR